MRVVQVAQVFGALAVQALRLVEDQHERPAVGLVNEHVLQVVRELVAAAGRDLAEQLQRDRASDREHRRLDLHLDPDHAEVLAAAQ